MQLKHCITSQLTPIQESFVVSRYKDISDQVCVVLTEMVQVAQAAAAALSLGADVPDRQQGHTHRHSAAAGVLTTTMRRPTGGEEGERLLGKMERRAAVSIHRTRKRQIFCLANVLMRPCCPVTRSVVVAVQRWQITMLPENSKRRPRQCVVGPAYRYR